ncbi:hypothetical protein KFE80_07210 [bacterium SCSIO 12696]|nr:hypothetical protein KFE80_07210 [bacterium SCSIO 12696]
MEDKTDIKVQACELAKALLDSDVNYLDNVIELWRLGNSFYDERWGTEFHVFGVIESDTDHLPTEKVRQYCSSMLLERSDKELKEVVNFYREDVKKACSEILTKYQSA